MLCFEERCCQKFVVVYVLYEEQYRQYRSFLFFLVFGSSSPAERECCHVSKAEIPRVLLDFIEEGSMEQSDSVKSSMALYENF